MAVGALVLLLTLLTMAIMDDPTPSQDIRILDWIVGWDFWGVTTLLKIVSTITNNMAGFVYVALAAIYLLLTGKAKAAIVFTGRVGGHHPTTGIPGKDFSCFSKWARLYRHSVFLVRQFLEHLLPFRGKISAANVSRLHCHRTVGWPIQSPCSGPLPK